MEAANEGSIPFSTSTIDNTKIQCTLVSNTGRISETGLIFICMKHDIKEKLHEAFKVSGRVYEVLKNDRGERILVGEDGLLGHGDTFISWEDIEGYMAKCRGTADCASNLKADAPRRDKFQMNK